MKKITLLLVLNIILVTTISCSNSNPAKNGNIPAAPTYQEYVENNNFDSITEINLLGLAKPTLIRVAKNKNQSIISFLSDNATAKKYKTLYVQTNDKAVTFKVTDDGLLFETKFDTTPKVKSDIDTQLQPFIRLMKAYHTKDIYRCRSSKFWPLLVKHVPEKRGYALLRLGQSLQLIEQKLDITLAIDPSSKEVSDFNIKILDTSSAEIYYTSSNIKDEDYVYGAIGDITRPLDVFQIACSQAYEKSFPNLYGFILLPNADPKISENADRYLQNSFSKDALSLEKLDVSIFNKYNEPIDINSITERLELMSFFIQPQQLEFYDQSTLQIKENTKTKDLLL
jgi:hypothetical protein